jgi:hypothetical protein
MNKKKQKPTTKQTPSKQDYQLIGKVAKRAIKLEPELAWWGGPHSWLGDRGQTDLMMDLTVCHSKHFKLRLSEMLKTKDTFSLMHDIYMIAASVNKENLGWDGLGSPRFTETRLAHI